MFEVSGGGVVTVVCGVVGELHAGETVICRGRYENHSTYGRQFHAQGVRPICPGSGGGLCLFGQLCHRILGQNRADKII